jgi:iron complex outermembrane receptor protein
MRDVRSPQTDVCWLDWWKRRTASLLLAVACTFGLAEEALAGDQTKLEEVVVTAEKRPESVQEVPISLSVVTSEQLAERGVEGVEGYARGVPGLAFTTSAPGQTRFSLRGIPDIGGTGPTVSFYLDDAPITSDDNRTSSSDPPIFDVARIEVLRGPQGTLYGASSLGGTIRIISNQPNLKEYSGNLTATGSGIADGSHNYGGQAVLNAPIVTDTFAVRVSGFYRHEGGFVDRIPNPALLALTALSPTDRSAIAAGAKDIDSANISSGRVVALWQATEHLSISPSVFVFKNDYRNISQIDSGFKKRLVTSTATDEPRSDGDTDYSIVGRYDLGGAQVTSSTSYVDRDFTGKTDFTGFLAQIFGNSPVTTFNIGSTQNIFTEEARIASVGHRTVDWLGGVYYNRFLEHGRADLSSPGFSAAIGLPPGLIPGDVFFRKAAFSKRQELAFFGNGTWNVSERVALKLGLRQFSGKNDFRDDDIGFFNGGASSTSGSANYDGVIPKIDASFKVTPSQMIYASVGKGYRAGGANFIVPQGVCGADLAALGLATTPTVFNPDSLWNYEVGAKTAWLEERLILNAAVYDIEWSKIQLKQDLKCGFSFQTNGGHATSKGFELEMTGRATSRFELTGGIGYADAHLTEASANIPGSVAGSRIPGAPDFTANVATTYRVPLTAGYIAHLSEIYRFSAAFADTLGPVTALNRRDKISTLDVVLGVEDKRWSFAVFANNVFNQIAITGENDTGNLVQWAVTRPRTVGARATITF